MTSCFGFNCRILSHAGYAYSGKTAAAAYKALVRDDFKAKIRIIFLLGPFHKHSSKTDGQICTFQKLATPFRKWSLLVNQDVCAELSSQHGELLSPMSAAVDESEHCLEMQYPFLSYVIKDAPITVVPILVARSSNALASALLPYFEQSDTLWIVSSDFCHWGQRFDYTFASGLKNISKAISDLDHQAIDILRNISKDPKQTLADFVSYLERTKNTICGRVPIKLLLLMLSALSENRFNFNLVAYDQSNKVKSIRDSSVSYVAATITE